jgi:cation-transporting P-type ATPase F
MREILDFTWHSMSPEEIADKLETSMEIGLTSEDALTRRRRFGENSITIRKKSGAITQFLQQFRQPLVFILVVAGAITVFLQEWIDSSVIFGVVFINATVGFIQEHRANKAMQALVRIVTSENVVIRDGKKIMISSTDIVPGDIVILRSGDKIPADARLFHTKDLRIDESVLTGESLPSQKHEERLQADTIFAERKNMAYGGTLVTNGYGSGIIVSTGDHTETGKISKTMYEAQEMETPLTRKIAQFSKALLFVILGLTVLTFVVGWQIVQRDTAELFIEVVALAVAAIPEGLPAAMTITLAIGVNYMAKKHAIIRKLPAVETLGSTTVICSDKTGTITENQMTVKEVYAGGNTFFVSGTGYSPAGEFFSDKNVRINPKNHYALTECLICGLACNDSDLIQNETQWVARGDPTEVALIVSALKGEIRSTELEALPRIDTIPFESHLQFMATLHRNPDSNVVYAKGALERILGMCSHHIDAQSNQAELSKSDFVNLYSVAEKMELKGLRVLAFAKKGIPQSVEKIEVADVDSGLTFLGFQAMLDPPRPEVIDAIRECQNAGITVKMISGDGLNTAINIGQQIGLNKNGKLRAITGRELERYSEAEMVEVANNTDVFARVLPDQKFALVRALQSKGNIVAMTGDGVNDAPALKQADIGIAMGMSGTEVAKEASDIVLTDDNFASIKSAVEEGRRTLDTLIKFIVWTLPTNFGEGMIVLAAIFMGMALPIIPVQILWINMTTAIALGMMLIFEPKEYDIMKRPPRNPKSSILTFTLVMRIVLVSSIIMLSAFVLFQAELENGTPIEEARTIAVNTVVMIEIFYLFNCRSLNKSMFSIGLFSNRWILIGVGVMLALQAMFTYLPVMNELFDTRPVSFEAWMKILGVAAATFVIIEIEKWISGRLKIASKR